MDKALSDYLSRLTGTTVTEQSTIVLSSAQVGSAYAWMTKRGLAFNQAALLSRSFTPASLLSAEALPASNVVALPSPRQAAPSVPVGMAVGIDIEQVASMPVCADFWEEGFYVMNFTRSEIAHCIASSYPRQSFCGLWAAKEAAVKAGIGPSKPMTLKHIEIRHAPDGRPILDGVSVSISHAGETCVAVAVRADAPPVASSVEQPVQQRPVEQPKRRGMHGIFFGLFGAVVAVAVAGSYFSFDLLP